jgi:adenylate kinase family enzyme
MASIMKPQSFIFIGRYGAGKGTQAKLLMEALKESDSSHDVLYIETGAEFRKFMAGDDYTAKLSKQTVEQGRLMPEFMPVYLWGRVLVGKYTGNEHIVFDGTPRKLMEAKILESVFPFYSLGKPWVIYLDVHHEESHKRIKLRSQSSGRADDGTKEIENRKAAFENDVVPTIEWFRTNQSVNFLDIDGVRSIEEIHADIVKRVGLA